jgi:hydrogenase expression/formation protein HypD
MRYVDEFRNKSLIDKVARQIRAAAKPDRVYTFMEVCGTHTMNVFRFGLRELLPVNIRLLSGPGCPVCVTPNEYIDKAVTLSRLEDVVITTFGDMFRVPGSRSSLEKEKTRGAAIKTVYSTDDALAIAKRRPDKQVIFLGVGFETTAPTIAQSILTARGQKINNYSVLCGHKTMPEALKALVTDKALNVDGFLLPGHVSAIIGTKPYEFIARGYRKRCVVAGFEPLDIMQAILMLVRQERPGVDVQYTRIIEKGGNLLALRTMGKVFLKTASEWRGIGRIKDSGLKIRNGFSDYDAEKKFKIKIQSPTEKRGCICGEVLKGTKIPTDCALFGKACRPENPVGACMVSSEGTCAAYYRYGKTERLGIGYRV